VEANPCKSDFVNVNGIRLHYLDWGGEGPVLLFLAGLGCSAHIFERFAPRFVDRYHVIALTRRGHGESDYPENGYDVDTLSEDVHLFLEALGVDQAILAGHSLGYLELSRLAILHPQRVLALVFLDAAYDGTWEEYRSAMQQNPLGKLMLPWPYGMFSTLDEYTGEVKRRFPALACVWDVLEGDVKYSVMLDQNGKIVDKMTDVIGDALNQTAANYSPEYSKIRAPVLSFFAIRDGRDYLSSDFMTKVQKSDVLVWINTILHPQQAKWIQRFQENVPQARIIEIPRGHHYCFIKQEEFVYAEMREFLLEIC